MFCLNEGGTWESQASIFGMAPKRHVSDDVMAVSTGVGLQLVKSNRLPFLFFFNPVSLAISLGVVTAAAKNVDAPSAVKVPVVYSPGA